MDLDGNMSISYREFRKFMKEIDLSRVNENPSPARSREQSVSKLETKNLSIISQPEHKS